MGGCGVVLGVPGQLEAEFEKKPLPSLEMDNLGVPLKV